MPKRLPTPAQETIMKLLDSSPCLTTRQINEEIGGTTKRATERKLKRLADHGFVESRLLQPERGAASERCWLVIELGQSRCAPMSTETLSEEGVLTPQQMAVLQLLATMKQLTTSQIRQHLHTGNPRWYTWKLLWLLRQRGYITGHAVSPERGAASEYYWAITNRGARATGIEYGKSHSTSA